MPTSVTHQGHTPGARLPSQIARSGVRTPGGGYGGVSIPCGLVLGCCGLHEPMTLPAL